MASPPAKGAHGQREEAEDPKAESDVDEIGHGMAPPGWFVQIMRAEAVSAPCGKRIAGIRRA